jgi:hypothetical protein
MPNYIKRKAYNRFNLEGSLKAIEDEEREELFAHRPHDYSFADNQDKYT